MKIVKEGRDTIVLNWEYSDNRFVLPSVGESRRSEWEVVGLEVQMTGPCRAAEISVQYTKFGGYS